VQPRPTPPQARRRARACLPDLVAAVLVRLWTLGAGLQLIVGVYFLGADPIRGVDPARHSVAPLAAARRRHSDTRHAHSRADPQS
jgi:hypothetical protein